MSRSPRRAYKQVARAKAQEETRETLLQAATEEVEQDSWSHVEEAVVEMIERLIAPDDAGDDSDDFPT